MLTADDIATRLEAQRIMRERINAKTCGLWPDCSCFSTIEKWAKDLSDEGKIWIWKF